MRPKSHIERESVKTCHQCRFSVLNIDHHLVCIRGQVDFPIPRYSVDPQDFMKCHVGPLDVCDEFKREKVDSIPLSSWEG